jgi:hypothetical protein
MLSAQAFVAESRCGAVSVGRTYLSPPLSSGGALVVRPWLRFHIFLIEPTGGFLASGSRTRLHAFAHGTSRPSALKRTTRSARRRYGIRPNFALNSASREALKADTVKAGFVPFAYEPAGTSPNEFAKLMNSDFDRWGAIVRASGFSRRSRPPFAPNLEQTWSVIPGRVR